MPRPALPAPDRRSVTVGIRLTQADADALRDRAAASGRTVSSLIAEFILVGGARMPRPVAPINAAAWSRLAATTANLNQLTHHLNSLALSGGPLSLAFRSLPAALDSLRQEVTSLRAELVGNRAGGAE